MKTLEHAQVRNQILSGDPLAEMGLAEHLESCPDCQTFARQVQQQASIIKDTLRARWDPVEPPPQSKYSHIHIRRNTMVRKFSSSYGVLAWAGGLFLLVVVLGWAIPRLVLGEVFPAAPSFLRLFLPRPLIASEIMPPAEDLGEGWLVTADKADINGSYYFDVDQNGYPIIGTHVNNTEYPFDQDLIETVSMRGYAHPEQHSTLMAGVFVFKDTEGAETVAKKMLPDVGVDRDVPMEQYTFTDVAMGDEAKMVSLHGTPDEGLSMITLGFRKGRVLAMIITLGTDKSPAKALNESQMLEIGRTIESRIP